MAKKKKRWIGMLLTLCLLMTMSPMSAFADGEGGITVTLDNGEYNSDYTTTYGKVEYSTDYNESIPGSGTWKEIGSDTIHSTNESPDPSDPSGNSTRINHSYEIPEVSSVWIRATVAEGKTYDIGLFTDSNTSLTNGVPMQLTDGCHLGFQSPQPGNPQPGDPQPGDPQPSDPQPGDPQPGVTYTIEAAAGEHGVIDNTSPIEVQDHGSTGIIITPDYGYEIDAITIDKDTENDYTLNAEELETVLRDNGEYHFNDVTSNHTIYVTFKTMKVAPPVFSDYAKIQTRLEKTLFAYSVSGNDEMKTCLCEDLWDMISHEYQGAFVNKASLVQKVTVTSTSPLTKDTLPGKEGAIQVPYYSYSLELTSGMTISGKIYELQENAIMIQSLKNESYIYDIETLTGTTNQWGEPSYDNKDVIIDYDSRDVVQIGGAHIEGITGKTDYCFSLHLSMPNGGGCQLFVYKPEFEGAKANYTGETKVAAAWDFGNTPFVVFNDTTKNDPFVLTTYFGYTSLTLNALLGETVRNISTDLPRGAVTIANNKITFNSNYYDAIPLTVTYNSGGADKKGYVLIKRVGIDIQKYTKGETATCQTNHGTQPGIVFPWENADYAIYATYYYPSAQNSNVSLYCTYTWKDGSITTSLITEHKKTQDPYDFLTDADDFCVYKGSAQNKPVSVSIIAVKEGAFSGESFGGATIGAGAGVTWKAEGGI